MENLDRLFNPRSMALIGASGTPGKWGFHIFLNILKADYQGVIYPVNTRQASILGFKCYASVRDIPAEIDVAMITTPAGLVSPLIDECGEKGVPYVVVVTSDFSETGPEGARLEKEIVTKARRYGLRLVGPNTMGIFSAQTCLHALMPPIMPLPGNISMVSQSGNIGVQVMFWGKGEGLGFEKFVSSGNEGDLTCEDYLDYFAQDQDTRVIMAYLEGVDPDSKLLSAGQEASRRKPVVVFKGGRTNSGMRAAASHSGALAGEALIYSAAFRQSGMIEAATTQEMMDCAKALAYSPLPRGNRVGILTRGGGWGVVTTDSCEENGLVVTQLPKELVEKFSQILPVYWSRNNPVDMAATVTRKAFIDCLDILAEWDGIDAVMALAGGQGMTYESAPGLTGPKELLETITLTAKRGLTSSEDTDIISQHVSRLVQQTGKPIFAVNVGSAERHKKVLLDYGVVSFPTPERAVRVLRHMAQYGNYLNSH